MATADLSKLKDLPVAMSMIDIPKIRHDAQQLVRMFFNPHQLKFNSILLQKVALELDEWLQSEFRTVESQLEDVPKHARAKWLHDYFGGERRQPEQQAARHLTDFLSRRISRGLQYLARLKLGNRQFRKSLNSSITERREIILDYARQLGSNENELALDRRAFGRWFDEEAVNDRYLKAVGETELYVSFLFDRLGVMTAHVTQIALKPDTEQALLANNISGIWARINILDRISETLDYEGDERIHAAAISCLQTALDVVPSDFAADLLHPKLVKLLHRFTTEPKTDVWLQCSSISVLTKAFPEDADNILNRRLANPAGPDDIFVRRHVLKLMEKRISEVSRPPTNYVNLLSDESAFVRQQAARLVFVSKGESARRVWQQLVLEDSVEQVRAAALLCLLQTEFESLKFTEALQTVVKSLQTESQPFVVRTAMFVAQQFIDQLINRSPDVDEDTKNYFREQYQQQVLPAIQRVEFNHEENSVRRWAAQAYEKIWATLDPQANELVQKLRPQLLALPVGRSRRFPKSWFRDLSDEQVGRIFAVLSQDDFGYDVRRGWFGVKVTRGPQFGFRLWRFLFEFMTIATDKRQGISHSVGRISTSTLRAPSQILGELSETKVPGEPLTIASDGTWRPFLPLLDDFVSVLNMSWFVSRKVRFFTSQGVTVVSGPKSIWNQFRAAWQLSFRFKKIADLRNWEDSGFPANSYIEQMQSLGFGIEFHRHEVDAVSKAAAEEAKEVDGLEQSESSDSSVQQFFKAAACVAPLLIPFTAQLTAQSYFMNYVYRFVDYFSSAFENTLEELVVFGVIVLALFCFKHFWANYSFRKARRKIPLSVGGWGTRGKSGTERLKAALFGVVGHGVVSKTTGCEAMFIQGHAYGDPIEIPLFRPYDKATIWEQRDLICLAAKLDPSVFLWECMALNPSYVDLLQRQWMQDDIATITNTYPDHEDVQGPAGYNVAQTICHFVPLNSVCISTEQVMRPYVTEECRVANTRFQGVGWLESGLVTEDILARFPYQEHPDNIALVATMAGFLGVNYEYSLKAMADYLVPDLGVLKTHPISTVRSRKIEFTNGCSANERFGCMGNWKRLGFDGQDPWEEPCTWITGVVNNRADRVPRSKVFAKIIVEDINADRFFLIGNNLKGLQGFVQEAWDEYVAGLSLSEPGAEWETDYAVKAFDQYAWNMRQPIKPEHVSQKLQGMLTSLLGDGVVDVATMDDEAKIQSSLQANNVDESQVQSVLKHWQAWQNAVRDYEQMHARVASGMAGDSKSIESEFRELMTKWFFQKLVFVENYFASGEEVLHTVVEETPPGFTNRVMGLQNIKGTGLDFVYRFQAWDMCKEACDAVRSKQQPAIEKGLQTLVAMPVIGQLCEELVAETIAWCRTNKDLAKYSDLVDQLEQNLAARQSVAAAGDNESGDSSSNVRKQLTDWMYSAGEQLLDVNDSVRRRERADTIYEDLGAMRISRQRAITELRKINKRQKGGWLKETKAETKAA